MSLPPRGRRGRGGQDGHDPRARIRTRERRTMDLTVLGWSQQQIAADLGVTQAAVSKILNRVERRALRELTATVERHKVRHTQRWTPSFGQVFVTAKVESGFMIQATLGCSETGRRPGL